MAGHLVPRGLRRPANDWLTTGGEWLAGAIGPPRPPLSSRDRGGRGGYRAHHA
jgi:hypothetical protein